MSTKDSSVAPKERINVRFVPATGGEEAGIELPMKTVVMGDFTGREDDTAVEEREAININKNNFDDVFKSLNINSDLVVDNALTDEDQESVLQVKLKLDSMEDFRPDHIAQQVPEIKSLVDLRDALTALKGPLGNMPDFRRALNNLIEDPDMRDAIAQELSESMASSEEAADSDENTDS